MSSPRFLFSCVVVATVAVCLGCSGMQTGPQTARIISIPPGMRAVKVLVKGAAGIVPGTRVDVLVNDNPKRSESHAVTILQGVEVVASEQEEPESLGVITLLTSPKDAEEITLASEKGRIQLVLVHHGTGADAVHAWTIDGEGIGQSFLGCEKSDDYSNR